MAKATKAVKKHHARKRKVPTSGTIPLAEFLELQFVRVLAAEAKQSIVRPELPDKLANHVDIRVLAPSDEQQVNCLFEFSLRGLYGDEEEPRIPNESPLYVRAVFHSRYQKKPGADLSPEQLQLFSQSAGILVVWPYWREFVQSMTSRMGQPTLTLPLVQMGNIGIIQPTQPPKRKPKGKREV